MMKKYQESEQEQKKLHQIISKLIQKNKLSQYK